MERPKGYKSIEELNPQLPETDLLHEHIIQIVMDTSPISDYRIFALTNWGRIFNYSKNLDLWHKVRMPWEKKKK